MKASTIANNYMNGNLLYVQEQLTEGTEDQPLIIAGRTMSVYSCLIENFGQKHARNFSNWIINHYSDL